MRCVIKLIRLYGELKDIVRLRKLHQTILQNNQLNNDKLLLNLLIQAYGSCGSLSEGRAIFNTIASPNSFSWAILLQMHAHHSLVEECKQIFDSIPEYRNIVCWTAMLSAFADNGDMLHAEEIHYKMPEWSVFCCSRMITGWACLGVLEESRSIFDSMVERNIISWTAMLQGYALNGYIDQAKSFADKMPVLNQIAFAAMLMGLVQLGMFSDAESWFNYMPEHDLFSSNAMIGVYGECFKLEEVITIFTSMVDRNVVSWTSFAEALVVSRCWKNARSILDKIPQLSAVSFTVMLQLNAESGELDSCKELFDMMPERDLVSWTTLLVAYSSSYGEENLVEQVFDRMPQVDVISWKVLLSACSIKWGPHRVLDEFKRAPVRDSSSWKMVLGALDQPELAEAFFDRLPRWSLASCNVMISMYSEGRHLEKAKLLFDSMPEHDIVSCTAMITGFANNGLVNRAVEVFDEVLDVASWNSMIAALANSGSCSQAIEQLRCLTLQGLSYQAAAAASVLAACSRAGEPEVGRLVFASMVEDHWLTPSREHYSCIVDSLARTGRVIEALELIENMPFYPDVIEYRALLAAWIFI